MNAYIVAPAFVSQKYVPVREDSGGYPLYDTLLALAGNRFDPYKHTAKVLYMGEVVSEEPLSRDRMLEISTGRCFLEIRRRI